MARNRDTPRNNRVIIDNGFIPYHNKVLVGELFTPRNTNYWLIIDSHLAMIKSSFKMDSHLAKIKTLFIVDLHVAIIKYWFIMDSQFAIIKHWFIMNSQPTTESMGKLWMHIPQQQCIDYWLIMDSQHTKILCHSFIMKERERKRTIT